MASKNLINFTKKGLSALPTPEEGKRGVYFDTQVKGLNIIITDKGNKSFYIRKVIDGKSKRIRIGAFPDLSVENARNMAMDIKSAIAKGDNPHEQFQKEKSTPVLSDFFEVYMERHSRIHKKTSDYDKYQYKKYIKNKFGAEKLIHIKREEIRNFHSELGKTGTYTANRVLELLRVIFRKAIEWSVISGENPASLIKPFKEKSRDRFLQKDELPRFFKALEEEPNVDIRDYIWLSLLTGARKSNILEMKWKDISFEHEKWKIPETKNGEPQTIPLVTPAIELLNQRKKSDKIDKDSPFIFPSISKTGHMVEVKSGWKRILKRAEIEDLRLHDLRRTLGSYQAGLGTSLHIIGKSLGHKSHQATQIYARLDLDPVRESMKQATDFMISLGEMKND